MKKFTAATLLLSCILTLTACNRISAKNLMDGIGRSSSGAAEVTHTEAVTDFAVELFKASSNDGENTLISPLSVLCALSMTANGAAGNTLDELEAALMLDADELNSFIVAYTKALPRSAEYKLNIANSIWFTDDERFTVKGDFLQTNADFYGADIYKAPFDSTTKNDINFWVSEKTDGMIKNMLDDIPSDAVMYLVNALAFDAEWENIYYDHQVKKSTFTNGDSEKQKVHFMYSDEYGYLEDESAKGFIKYYYDRKYAFVAMLPNEEISVSDYVNGLTGSHLADLLSSPLPVTVETAIPKFEFGYSVEMSETLNNMGITDAFDPIAADFSRLGSSAAGNIFINRVLHKTYIGVNERGTRAGAATIVEMADGAMAITEEPRRVYLDRPFIFMIIDCEHRIPVFMGTVSEV